MSDPDGIELSPLAIEPDTLFGQGWSSRWPQSTVPWDTVQQMMSMAKHALEAKQLAAEALLKDLDHCGKRGANEELLQRACRAEADSGSLLEELEALIQAKAHLHAQRADLDRANALLMAERELLCEQLDVAPTNANLCQEVQKVLAAARRARGLETQLRMLARCQRELLLQLEATREDGARAAQHWQACEQVYLQALAAHSIAKPDLPPAPTAVHRLSSHNSSNSSTSAGVEMQAGTYASSSSSSGSAAAVQGCMYAALQRLGSAGASTSFRTWGIDALIGSPSASHGQFLPATPPASDLNAARAGPALLHMRRSHSLDSGLNSLTGLLDQLALGQLGSDDGCSLSSEEYDRDDWMLVGSDEGPAAATAAAAGTANSGSTASSAQHLHGAASRSGAAGTAAAALLLLASGPNAAERLQHQQHQQQLEQPHQQQQFTSARLQPVQETAAE